MSGVGPQMKDGKPAYVGRLGEELDVQQGAAAARSVGITMLGALHAVTGDLNRVKAILKVLGFVNSTPEFGQHIAVIDGFSSLMAEVFGPEVGAHARAPVGCSSLPFNIPVMVEMLVELAQRPLPAGPTTACHTSWRPSRSRSAICASVVNSPGPMG
ncbi:MAG: RidA family protein [Candidatus Latescibacterota bacterium]